MSKEDQTLEQNKITARNMKQIIIKSWRMIPRDQLVQPIVTNLNRTNPEAIIIHNQREHRAFLITWITMEDKLEQMRAKLV